MDYREWVEQNREDLPQEVFQQPDESDLHYSAFLYYLYLGRGRSINRAYYLYAKERGLIDQDLVYDRKTFHVSRTFRQYSIDNNWIKRAETLDRWIDAKRLHQTIERQSLVEDKTWDDYLLLRSRMTDTLESIEERSEDNDVTFSARALKDLALAFKYISDVGRKAAGLPTNISAKEKDTEGSNGKLSSDDLQTLDQRAKKELEQWQKDRESDE